MSEKQRIKYNAMRAALIEIASKYQTPDKLRKSKDAEFLGFDELITMSYENIQETARRAVKGVKFIPQQTQPVK
jgi:hypothetical protein